MSAPFRLDWEGSSDVGNVRKVNEDSFAALPEHGVWIVADGMGGHQGGDWASARVVAALAQLAPAASFETAVDHCAQGLHAANAEIWAEASARGGQMGSTAVLLLLRDRRFAALWAGDSRAWLHRGGVLHQLTRDHSQVQALVDRGVLTLEEAAGHPMSHVLARAVGTEPAIEVDVVMDETEPGDIFLLTSDGVHGVLPRRELETLLGAADLSRLPDTIIARALDRGSTDNCTAVIVRLHEPTLLQFAAPAEATR